MRSFSVPLSYSWMPVRFFVALSLCITIGCSTGTHSTFSSLADQGILTVSSDNPFVGANIFLASEMEESRYLYNFMREKGSPQAIELTGHDIADSELKLFYSGRQEMYTAVPHFDRSLGTKEWVVRGPYSLDRASYRQVTALPASQGGVFQVFGKREVFGAEARALETRVIPPVFIEPPKPKAAPRRVATKRAAKASADTPKAPAKEDPLSNPTNLDQEAIAEARRGKKSQETASREPSVSVTIGSNSSAQKAVTPPPARPTEPQPSSPTPMPKGTKAPHS